MVKDLEDLKAENAQKEAEASAPPQAVEEEVDGGAAEVEAEEPAEVAEPEQEGAEETEVESWMLTDEEEVETGSEAKFTGSDIKAAKSKLKAKLQKKDNEVESLRQELEALKRGPQQAPPAQALGQQPKREDFYEHDDPDGAFIQASIAYNNHRQQLAQQQHAMQAQQQQAHQAQKAAVTTKVDAHYERAIKLAEKSGITAEQYQNADLSVRQNIDAVMPGGGEEITDKLIATLGEGSEKVFYQLGVNPRRMNELSAHLRSDPTGLTAMAYLGELKANISTPQKRKTKAPKPTTQIQGDSSVSQSEGAWLKKYKKAGSNIQERINIKRDAKREGVNTSNW